jgi:DNA-binding CsgD family transcriptional regulator
MDKALVSVSETTVLIARPPQVVWDFIGDPENWPIYGPGLEKVVRTKGRKFEVGAVYEGRGSLLLVPFRFTSEVVVADEPSVGSIRSVIASFAFTATGFYREVEFGTETTMRVEIESEWGGLFRGITETLSSFVYQRQLEAQMLHVADCIDGGARGGLTNIQRKIIGHLQQGESDREIAERLSLSPRIVGHHVDAIMRAFRVPVRQALILGDPRSG